MFCALFNCSWNFSFSGNYVESQLIKYDLNGNRFFDREECLSANCKKLMGKFTNDTGRNLSIVTGGICALAITLPTLLLGLNFEKLKNINYTHQRP